MPMTLIQALQNGLWFVLPCLVYAAFVGWRYKFSIAEITGRLGLRFGPTRWYGYALLLALPLCVVVVGISQWTKGFEGSMLAPFTNQPASSAFVWAAVVYGLVGTGLPEEVLFRGLIGGALFRRYSLARANILQSAVFVAPHLLLLLVAPELWPLIVLVAILGMTAGWLRQRSGSVLPGVIVHGLPNMVGALAVLVWS
jgi:membrane protease YdiL (CAAX protease family)